MGRPSLYLALSLLKNNDERIGGEMNMEDIETPCLKREDGQHCNCWYDGGTCCACNDPLQVWCAGCGYHVEGGLCGYDTPCVAPSPTSGVEKP